MKATAKNTKGGCQRCGEIRTFVMASGFNEDSSFRMLCGPCDRIEHYRNNRPLFSDLYQRRQPVIIQPEPEPEEEPEPDHSNQFALFGGIE